MMLPYSWRRLLAAILVRAVRDAQGEDPQISGEARRWLRGPGENFAAALGFPSSEVEAWLVQLPDLPGEQLPLWRGASRYDYTSTTLAGAAPTSATHTTTSSACYQNYPKPSA